MVKLLANLAEPGKAFAAAFLISLVVTMLAGNALALVAAAFTLIQVVLVAFVLALMLLFIGLVAQGISR